MNRLFVAWLAGCTVFSHASVLASPDPVESAPQPQQAAAQDAAPPAEDAAAHLPPAEEIFERYVEAIGGLEKMKKITSRRIDGRYVGRPFTFPARLTVWQEFPNKYHLKIQQPAGETIEICFDGEVGWERMPGLGVRKIEGQRLIELRDTSDFWGEANFEARYVDMKTLGQFAFSDQQAVGVHVTALTGREKVVVFSLDTGLYLGTRTLTVHPETGKPEQFETVFRKYEDVGGVLWPMGMVQRFKGDEKGTEFDFVKVQVNLEEKHDFGLPAELKDAAPAPKPAE
jgi:outer membrane lipoprotein-sorting protein